MDKEIRLGECPECGSTTEDGICGSCTFLERYHMKETPLTKVEVLGLGAGDKVRIQFLADGYTVDAYMATTPYDEGYVFYGIPEFDDEPPHQGVPLAISMMDDDGSFTLQDCDGDRARFLKTKGDNR